MNRCQQLLNKSTAVKCYISEWSIQTSPDCECCPGHYLIVNCLPPMSGFKFRNLSVIVNCVVIEVIVVIAVIVIIVVFVVTLVIVVFVVVVVI